MFALVPQPIRGGLAVCLGDSSRMFPGVLAACFLFVGSFSMFSHCVSLCRPNASLIPSQFSRHRVPDDPYPRVFMVPASSSQGWHKDFSAHNSSSSMFPKILTTWLCLRSVFKNASKVGSSLGGSQISRFLYLAFPGLRAKCFVGVFAGRFRCPRNQSSDVSPSIPATYYRSSFCCLRRFECFQTHRLTAREAASHKNNENEQFLTNFAVSKRGKDGS